MLDFNSTTTFSERFEALINAGLQAREQIQCMGLDPHPLAGQGTTRLQHRSPSRHFHLHRRRRHRQGPQPLPPHRSRAQAEQRGQREDDRRPPSPPSALAFFPTHEAPRKALPSAGWTAKSAIL